MTNHQPVATTDATSERRLARSLGYPVSWHVARTVIPDPSSEADKFIVQDRIFAGDPAENADLYYNHGAAFEAASSWVEGESTPYDGEGGQMLPKQAKYKKNDDIQVKYDDGKWYNARITKVSVYPDDVRYTVLYTKENTYQNNVTEDEMRPRPKKAPAAKPKGKAKTPAKKGAAAKASTPKSKKGGGGKKRAASAAAAADDADPEELELASEIGLPEGWTARAKANSNYTIYSPGRTHRFTSKKAAFEHAGIDAPPAKKKAKKSAGKKKAGKKQKEEIDEEVVEIEEGDPPWRTDGHDFLHQKVKMTIDDGSELVGTVLGWIADTDVDKEGEPGFVSESTGKPACLFHVKFGNSSVIDSQDYEEYELEGKFVDE